MKRIDEVSMKIMFKIDKQFSNELINTWEEIQSDIKKMKKYNTDNIEPMITIFEGKTTFLRSDIPGKTMPVEDIISNAPDHKGDFILLPKVVKND
ncbi:Asp-tRNA(Asn)/Glu-tRNA(Gln) amidotransferase subunit GatC [Candidatus Mycoplasma mahonii]|uniref:Asp-tRNA(Asn)/Glu-tRNA(Gln) amidotransferase subunit GatC n=1 Tax=Candidatus Mycoplasma mahonii TaxID=3004105 RepID=UPI0026EA1CCC|nr:Asp-tRNA(Asn)/Glu-tRNA(Gln) amidotransferase subunit GatC [Candidatus Mycoplasma mahonii]WKX02524.1 aspartyl/glutamyl-tRNA amidotransferase subunit C [Candidatus Mycoplasma mahonii]